MNKPRPWPRWLRWARPLLGAAAAAALVTGAFAILAPTIDHERPPSPMYPLPPVVSKPLNTGQWPAHRSPGTELPEISDEAERYRRPAPAQRPTGSQP
ncbi:hypothetical protein IU501_31050 [Nocardia otitidiscaviarum]|uniref:hypothetical protein n=1 Tax=Nocardia otitidiscaviarum TaxID=1823 RepID=UPI0004A754EC|nr:hypothetical protein [Nocardia otitidiscaviarum]MBF6137416.1 hypothetical protein [Nocardia otitidiscaviarum]MBF6488322.1 hypothetical protein [Nocardia otitidiscaviarum]